MRWFLNIIFIGTVVIIAIIMRRMLKIYADELSSSLSETISSYEKLVGECKKIKETNDMLTGEISRIAGLYEMSKEMSVCLTKDALTKVATKGQDEILLQDSVIMKPLINLQMKRINLYETVQRLAITDGLTGIYVRRHFLDRFDEELLRAKHHNLNISVLMIDIDHFKEINDRYGHLVGDVVLKEITRLIQSNIREIDLLARYGGEEFVAALLDTSKDAAVVAAERIRENVGTSVIRAYDETVKVTISIGVAAYPEDGELKERLIEIADIALYRAKAEGRNQVCV